MAKNNEGRKLVKGVAKELQHIMEVEDLLCTFLSLDNEEKINELLGKIKNKKGADAWFNKVIKNTVHLIGDDNFKEEFETYVNSNRASLTDIIVNYDSSITEKTLKEFLNNTTKEEPKEKEENKEDKEKETVAYRTVIEKVVPKEICNKLPKCIMNLQVSKEECENINEDDVKNAKKYIDAYMEVGNLDALGKLSKKIDSKKLNPSPEFDLFNKVMEIGFENLDEDVILENKNQFKEDDIKILEIFASDLGMDVMKDVVKVLAMVEAEKAGLDSSKIDDELIEKQMGAVKEQFNNLVNLLQLPDLDKNFKIKVLDKVLEVEGSEWDDEIITNARKAIIDEFKIFGSGIAMLDFSLDLVLDAIKDNGGKWSDECYMKVFNKVLNTERKPFTLKLVKSLVVK